jgi:hypothetical protein
MPTSVLQMNPLYVTPGELIAAEEIHRSLTQDFEIKLLHRTDRLEDVVIERIVLPVYYIVLLGFVVFAFIR